MARLLLSIQPMVRPRRPGRRDGARPRIRRSTRHKRHASHSCKQGTALCDARTAQAIEPPPRRGSPRLSGVVTAAIHRLFFRLHPCRQFHMTITALGIHARARVLPLTTIHNTISLRHLSFSLSCYSKQIGFPLYLPPFSLCIFLL